MIRQAKQFFGHVVPAVIRPLHILLNEVVGLFFMIFAAMGLFYGQRYWRQLDTPDGSITRVVMTFAFALLMAYLGISSFWKARKISRS